MMAQYGSHVEMARKIHRSSFVPEPKVDTGVVRFVPFNRTPKLPFETMEIVCRALFSGPRKTVRNNTKVLLASKDPDQVDNFLASAAVDGSLRPSDLDQAAIERLGAAFDARE